MYKQIKVGDKTYLLAQDFDLLEHIEENTNTRFMKIYEAIENGDQSTIDLRTVIKSALVMCKKNDLTIDQADILSRKICTEVGFIGVTAIVNDILLECTVGKYTAKKLRSARTYDQLTLMINSQLPTSKRVIAQWAVISLISVGSLCGIFSFTKLVI